MRITVSTYDDKVVSVEVRQWREIEIRRPEVEGQVIHVPGW